KNWMTQDFILIVKNPLKIDSKIFFNMNQYVKIIKIMNFSGAMIQLNNWEDTFKNEYSDVIETFDCHSNSRYDIHRICDCVKLQSNFHNKILFLSKTRINNIKTSISDKSIRNTRI